MNVADRQAIEDRIREGIGRISVPQRAGAEVRPADSPGADLNVDSLGFLELIIGIENAYGMRFEDAFVSVQAFASVQALADYVVSAVSKPHAASAGAAS